MGDAVGRARQKAPEPVQKAVDATVRSSARSCIGRRRRWLRLSGGARTGLSRIASNCWPLARAWSRHCSPCAAAPKRMIEAMYKPFGMMPSAISAAAAGSRTRRAGRRHGQRVQRPPRRRCRTVSETRHSRTCADGTRAGTRGRRRTFDPVPGRALGRMLIGTREAAREPDRSH
jgi:hypothetical protein